MAYNRRRWGGDGWTHSLRRKGAAVGAPFANWKVWPNTLKAHRLMRLAGAERNDMMKAALFRACYEEGRNVSDTETLVELAVANGMDADTTRTYLCGDEGEAEVLQEIDEARRLGVSGVPFFVIDGDAVKRPFGFSGAVGSEELVALFEEVSGK